MGAYSAPLQTPQLQSLHHKDDVHVRTDTQIKFLHYPVYQNLSLKYMMQSIRN